MGQSASGIACDTTGGKFGPFANQLFVGDQSASTIMRVVLEKVGGRYQGACIPFRQGFASGNLPMLLTPEGKLVRRRHQPRLGLARDVSRSPSSGSTGPARSRSRSTTMHARPDGFELTFTQPVDPQAAGDTRSRYQSKRTPTSISPATAVPRSTRPHPSIEKAVVAEDGRSVRLCVSALAEGHVHELHVDGVRSAGAQPLLHPVAYYTMNAIPNP